MVALYRPKHRYVSYDSIFRIHCPRNKQLLFYTIIVFFTLLIILIYKDGSETRLLLSSSKTPTLLSAINIYVLHLILIPSNDFCLALSIYMY
jgi:hypothetical protein